MAEHKFQATFKLGKGYDDAWTTISSDDPNEFQQLVNSFRDQLSNTVAEAAAVVRGVNEAYRAGLVVPTGPVSAPAAPAQQYAQPAAAPVAAVVAPVAAAAAAAGPLPANVTITNDGVNAYIEYPFNRDFNAVVKGIGGRFDKVSKRWYVPSAQEPNLRQIASANFSA